MTNMKVNDRNELGMKRRDQRGFTLIELMIVVSIIGILAAFAYPQYQQYINKSRRSDGKALLTAVAGREEQYFMDNKAYTSNMTDLGYPVNPAVSEQKFYTVGATVTATGYTLTATPQGLQANDTACGNLTLKDDGTKGQSGTGTGCW